MPKDYYKTLKVKKSATLDQIKTSYRRLAKKYHPDLNPNNKNAHIRFIEIKDAYTILSNPQLRKNYNNTLRSNKRESRKNYNNTNRYTNSYNYKDQYNNTYKTDYKRNTYSYQNSEEKTNSNSAKNGASLFGKTILFIMTILFIYIISLVFNLDFTNYISL